MATRGVHTETKTVFDNATSTWTMSSGIERSILTWNFNWHYGEAKEDAFQKGLPVPDEAAIREWVLRKNVKALNLATKIDGHTGKFLLISNFRDNDDPSCCTQGLDYRP